MVQYYSAYWSLLALPEGAGGIFQAKSEYLRLWWSGDSDSNNEEAVSVYATHLPWCLPLEEKMLRSPGTPVSLTDCCGMILLVTPMSLVSLVGRRVSEMPKVKVCAIS